MFVVPLHKTRIALLLSVVCLFATSSRSQTEPATEHAYLLPTRFCKTAGGTKRFRCTRRALRRVTKHPPSRFKGCSPNVKSQTEARV